MVIYERGSVSVEYLIRCGRGRRAVWFGVWTQPALMVVNTLVTPRSQANEVIMEIKSY